VKAYGVLVLGHAFEVPQRKPTHLLQVSKGLHRWLLPIHYHSICFMSMNQMHRFLEVHDNQDEASSSRLGHVRSIWADKAMVELEVLGRCISICKGLEHLTALSSARMERRPFGWETVMESIPPSLVYLALGHEATMHFFTRDLRNSPPIIQLTVIDFPFPIMHELNMIIRYPSLKRIRNIVRPNYDPRGVRITGQLAKMRRESSQDTSLEYIISKRWMDTNGAGKRSELIELMQACPNVKVSHLESEEESAWHKFLFHEFQAKLCAFICEFHQFLIESCTKTWVSIPGRLETRTNRDKHYTSTGQAVNGTTIRIQQTERCCGHLEGSSRIKSVLLT
jgi:hypothetical protein